MIEHKDQLGQPIEVGAYVALTYAHSRRVYVGTVIKLTKQRVRLAFTNSWERNGEIHYYNTRHIARPDDLVVLGEELPKHLTMAKLKGKV